MSGKIYSQQIKDEVVGKIRSEGISAPEAAKRYGINVKNIYRWLSSGIGGSSSQVLEINRLKRENGSLKQIIGHLMLEAERGKKS